MANNNLYSVWQNLEEGLRTGTPQNGSKSGDHDYDSVYNQPEKVKIFVKSMEDIQAVNFKKFAEKFDFSKYKTVLDVGGSGGLLSITVAKANPHLSCITLDLALILPIAKANIEKQGVTAQV